MGENLDHLKRTLNDLKSYNDVVMYLHILQLEKDGHQEELKMALQIKERLRLLIKYVD